MDVGNTDIIPGTELFPYAAVIDQNLAFQGILPPAKLDECVRAIRHQTDAAKPDLAANEARPSS